MLRAFALGLIAGCVYFSGTLYWITRVMMMYGGLQVWVAVLVNAALIAYLALFPAIFALVMRRLLAANGRTAMLAAPFVWTATELGRTHLFTGFPWVLLGYSQVTVLPIAQLASVVGVFGLSALVASSSAALAYAALSTTAIAASGSTRTFNLLRPYIPFAAVVAIIVAAAAWGSLRLKRSDLTRQGDVVRVGLIQGNVEQSERENPARQPAIFQSYLRMTRQAIGEGAELVLWPESSTPFYFEEDRPGADQVRTLARQAHVPILLGSDQIGWETKNGQRVPAKYYNSAFLVRADGTTAGYYRKMHLVPFGEYVPLKQLFFFAAPLVQAVSDFSPGDSAALLEVRLKPDPTRPEKTHLMSTAICYEIVYPDLVRQFVVAGSELLSTITNDAWFGKTSAPYQHFAQASMRAIEEGRYLVRSANTGISGVVDPYGRVLTETRLYEPAVVVAEARFLTFATVYSRLGDVFAYASVVLTIAWLVVARRRVQ
jgi:apolipoprotein N-acyltransferase